ncbi:hypothetical protein Acr_26g0012970 [Actinidia rufa]|uniref:Uncharacterized protein n=1 Tax=Actinidia rufa TaxID=165716 RepID=A0A7J0H4S9_9ERIC|nr:hypothetical protein Acr_26g0012970 [Actinidia rufa]
MGKRERCSDIFVRGGAERVEDGGPPSLLHEKCNPWGITGSTQHVAVCRGAERDGSAMVLVRAQRALRDLTESGLELVASLGTTIGIRAKFESPESHRSDFGGERKPISNSDQIRSAQKWRLSIPPDSSRRDEAPAPNRVKIGRRRSPHAPPEVRRVRSTHPKRARGRRRVPSTRPHAPARAQDGKCLILTEKPFLSFLGIPDSSARITPCGKPRMKDMEGDEQEDDWADQTMHWTQGTTVAEQTSEFQRATGRGQKKRPEKRSQEGGHRGQEKRRDKKNCPRNKAQDQSSEAATTAMMAVDESDVLLAASADEESDWISDSGIAYHLCRDKEVFSTHVACEGLVRMANDAIVGKGQSRSDEALKLVEEHSEFPRETGQDGWTRKTTVAQRHAKQAQEYLMDVLEGSTVEQESAKRCFGIRAEVWPDMRRCNRCRMSMKKLRGERQSRCTTTGARRRRNESLSLEISGGNLSSCAYKGGEMESRRLAKRRTLQRTPVRGSRAPKGAERDGSAMVLVRAQRALRDLTESGLELVAVRGEQD